MSKKGAYAHVGLPGLSELVNGDAPKADAVHQVGVTVIKTKRGVPTVIEVDGRRYQLQHTDQYKRT